MRGSGSAAALKARDGMSGQRLIGAHLPTTHPERRETRPGRCSGCLTRFVVDVRLPWPSRCPDCGGSVVSEGDVEPVARRLPFEGPRRPRRSRGGAAAASGLGTSMVRVQAVMPAVRRDADADVAATVRDRRSPAELAVRRWRRGGSNGERADKVRNGSTALATCGARTTARPAVPARCHDFRRRLSITVARATSPPAAFRARRAQSQSPAHAFTAADRHPRRLRRRDPANRSVSTTTISCTMRSLFSARYWRSTAAREPRSAQASPAPRATTSSCRTPTWSTTRLISPGCWPLPTSTARRSVYGSRLLTDRPAMFIRHWVGNRLLTALTNLLYGSSLSDMETCYKLIARRLFEEIDLVCNRFDIEPEITAKLLKKGDPGFNELPIS